MVKRDYYFIRLSLSIKQEFAKITYKLKKNIALTILVSYDYECVSLLNGILYVVVA